MTKHSIKLLLSASALFLGACGHMDGKVSESTEAEAAVENHGDLIAGAISSTDRWADDASRDEGRKPAETLMFTRVAPGMTVFEIEAGGGYFTELFSLLVGSDGAVVMQNPEGILQFVGDEINARLADDRLTNVSQSVTNFDALDAEDGSVDVATWMMGPHELYFKPENGGTLGDPAGSFAEIFRIVKSGGVFVAIDHSAVVGAPTTTGHDLHRIDKAHVIDMAKTAGFVLDGEADFLANPDDDRTMMVFAPDIRGKTDKFVLRFRKP